MIYVIIYYIIIEDECFVYVGEGGGNNVNFEREKDRLMNFVLLFFCVV